MNLLTKIEELLNTLLIRLQELFWTLVQKATPAKVKMWLEKFSALKMRFSLWLRTLPLLFKNWIVKKIVALKADVTGIDFKGKIKASYEAALARSNTNDKEVKGKLSSIKKVFMAPVLVVSQWLHGLSALQSVLLLSFTAASILSVFSISFEGQRLLKSIEASRAPASVEVEEEYMRPGYYKKQTRHVSFTGVRLPVYIPEVNDLRSIDIDFTVTLNTRESRMWLEKKEFQFRDHLILNIEPLMAAFPLEEEGKEIIRQKLILEVNEYLILNKIDAFVTELKLTYVLAN